MARLAIIADDLTGAADAAVAFARHGHPTRVLLDPTFDPSTDIVALTSETRHLASVAAAEQVRQIARHLSGTEWLYKKIDSTLRGNPAAELLALMDAAGETRALVAPAFPAQGRTTFAGRQLLDGVALEETSFGAEITTSSLPHIFHGDDACRSTRLIGLSDVRQGDRRLRTLLADPAPGVIVVDAATETDLDSIAAAALAAGLRLLSGSAGLCHALARLIAPLSTGEVDRVRPIVAGPVLAIAGSQHRTTIAQVESARSSGIVIIEPRGCSPSETARIINASRSFLRINRDHIISSHRIAASAIGDRDVAAWLAQAVERIVEQGLPGGLILTGGEVASAVCGRLHSGAIDLHGEVQPGIPWGILRGGPLDTLPIITKAGGFGDPTTLAAAFAFLHDND
jgi:uncharacterized protein YgbK (DUF1537 family)